MLLSVLLGVFVVACPAFADTQIAHTVDAQFTDPAEAVKAGSAGKTVYMDADWELTGALEVSGTLTIQMDGHRISLAKGSDAALFRLADKSSLTLVGSATEREFTYDAYTAGGTTKEAKVKSGGLLTGAERAAVRICDKESEPVNDVSLSFKNIAIAGNWAENGAAFFVNGYRSTAVLDNVKIQDNYVSKRGGAIYSTLTKDSSFYRTQPGFKVTMTNGSIISSNYAQYGGAAYLDRRYSSIEGGTIKDNVASEHGGGVYVTCTTPTIKDCTITGNKAKTGGGVYVYSYYDIALAGKVVVKDNTRSGDGSSDDLFLNSDFSVRLFSITRAYATNNVDEGSEIGIRTVHESSRCLVKSLTNYIEGAFFLDEKDDYHLEYRASDSQLFAVEGATTYPVTFRGTTTYYEAGSTVTVDASRSGDTRVFKCWNTEKSTGLPGGTITESSKYDPVLTFKMPEHSVNLMPEYAEPAANVCLLVASPVAGEALPQEGTLVLKDGSSVETGRVTVPLEWHEVASDGSETVVTGTAKSAADYTVGVAVAEDAKGGVLFSRDIAAANAAVWVGTEEDHTSSQVASVLVDTNTGTLSMRSRTISLGKTQLEKVYLGYVYVVGGTSRGALAGKLPAWAWAMLADGTTVKVDVDTTGEIDWPDGLFDGSGRVVNPADGKESQTWEVELPVTCNEKTANAKGLKETVRIVVSQSDTETVSAPTLVQAGGSLALDGDLGATVNVSCATDGATIKYKIDGGAEREYRDADGIALIGKEGASKKVSVEVWAVKGDFESEHVKTEYVLDDTLGKELVVKRRDTAIEQKTGSFKVLGDIGRAATITAPAWEGHAFDHWEGTDAPTGEDAYKGAVSVASFSVGLNLTAVYVPVVTELKLDLDAPVAGEKLAGSVSKIEAKAGESDSLEDVTAYFKKNGDGKLSVSWSPNDTKAGYLTTYIASISLEPSDSVGGASYRLSEDIKVDVNGGDTDLTASVMEIGGGYALVVTFPETGGAKLEKVVQPEARGVNFVAAEAAAESAAEGDWSFEDEDGEPVLPKEIAVMLTDGGYALVDVEWVSLEGFDAAAEEAQTVTVKGRVKLPSYIEQNGADLVVNQTLNVAAPERAEAPTASLEAGNYKGAQRVELSCGTEGATIRYTTDGTEPTEANGTVYTGAIELKRNATIKAKAFCEDMRASSVAAFTYTIEHEVRFDADGGSEVTSQWVADGEAVARPTDPTREGHEFLGWTFDGVAYDFSNPVNDDLELLASWKKRESEKDDGSDKKDGSDDKDDSDKEDDKSDGSDKKDDDSDDETDDEKGDVENGGGSGTQVRAETTTTTETVTTKASAKGEDDLPQTGNIVFGLIAPLAVAGIAAIMAASIICKRRAQ